VHKTELYLLTDQYKVVCDLSNSAVLTAFLTAPF